MKARPVEIIPIEPDAGNAAVGKHNLITPDRRPLALIMIYYASFSFFRGHCRDLYPSRGGVSPGARRHDYGGVFGSFYGPKCQGV